MKTATTPTPKAFQAPNGARYEIGFATLLGELRPCARRYRPDGNMDEIVGFNGPFHDERDAEAWAQIDSRYELAPEGTPITQRKRVQR